MPPHPKNPNPGLFFSRAMWNYGRSSFSTALARPAAAAKPLPPHPKVWHFFKGGGWVTAVPAAVTITVTLCGSACLSRPWGAAVAGPFPWGDATPCWARGSVPPHTMRPNPPPFSRSDLQNSPKWARLLLSVCPLKSSEVKQIDQSDISMHTKTLFWYVAPFVCGEHFISHSLFCVSRFIYSKSEIRVVIKVK